MAEEISTKMPTLPAWSQVRDTTVPTIIFTTFILIFGVVVFFFIRKRNKNAKELFERRRKEAHTFAPEPTPLVSDEHRFLSSDNITANDLSTRSFPPGLKVTVIIRKYQTSFNATIINVSNDEFVTTLPKFETGGMEPTEGDEAEILAVIDDRQWELTTKVRKVFTSGLGACSFNHVTDISPDNRRQQARITGNIPALFSAIPKELTRGPIPLLDLDGEVQGEIPAMMNDLSVGGCSLTTRSPLRFSVGDLLVVSFCFANESVEYTLICKLTYTASLPKSEGGGSILNMAFLAADDDFIEKLDKIVGKTLEEEIIE